MEDIRDTRQDQTDQTKTEEETAEITAARIVYADSCLRAFGWHVRELERCQREYAQLTYELSAATVSSPRIKSTEEAWYKSSPTYHSGGLSERVMEILDERDERQKDFDHAIHQLRAIGRYLQKIQAKYGPEMVQIVYERYEWNWTLQEIADEHYMSGEGVRKRIAQALAEF